MTYKAQARAPSVKPEDQARQDIDRQLEACGWIVQDRLSLNIRGRAFRAGRGARRTHLGDDLSERFDLPRRDFTRDALAALGHVAVTSALAVYGGATWSFNVDPNDTERNDVRGVGADAASLGDGDWGRRQTI